MTKLIRFGCAALVVFSALNCGGSTASVKPGPMPEGGNFSGVYHSPQYGEMNIIQTGDEVIGEFKKDERSGKIHGSVEGDIMRFEWVERKAMVSNRPTETRGRGYFRYIVDASTDEHVLKGEWGLGEDETGGGPWNAWKSKHSTPRLSTDSSGLSGGGDDDDLGGDDFGADEDDDLL
jgi:hypothetical protein